MCGQVISAHNLPKPLGSGAKGEVVDPYVVLELHGVPADCTEHRTRTAAQNSSPLYDETFEFQVGSVHRCTFTVTSPAAPRGSCWFGSEVFRGIIIGQCAASVFMQN